MKRYILLVLLLIVNIFSSLIVVANEDIQKPIITNMSTANMQILKESTISFDVYDLQTRVLKSSIEVKINNQKHTNLTFINIDKGFNVTIKGIKNLSEGLNEISVKVCDTENNESVLTWKVVKNNELPNMYFENQTNGIVGVSNKLDFYTDSLDFSNINLIIKYNPLKIKVDEIITSSKIFPRDIHFDNFTGMINIFITNSNVEKITEKLVSIKFTPIVEGVTRFEVLTYTYGTNTEPALTINLDKPLIEYDIKDEYDYSDFISTIALVDENNIIQDLKDFEKAYIEFKKFDENLIKNEEVLKDIEKMKKCIENYKVILEKLSQSNIQSENVEQLICGGKYGK